jgi:hypothetical protein
MFSTHLAPSDHSAASTCKFFICTQALELFKYHMLHLADGVKFHAIPTLLMTSHVEKSKGIKPDLRGYPTISQ